MIPIGAELSDRARHAWLERGVLAALAAVLAYKSVLLVRLVMAYQPLGLDFLPLWTGGRVDPARLYDFAHVTAEQAWLYVGKVRPFVYPPSSLIFFKPWAAMPYWIAYGASMAAGVALFAYAGWRLGGRWWLALLTPPVALVAAAGQVTLLVGALVMIALTLKTRPLLAGVLFGVVGAIKPQMLVLLPLALAVEGNWRAFWSTGVTALTLAAASLVFGASWVEWLKALPRFAELVATDWSLVATMATPYARWGAASLIVTVPAVLAGLWLAFRSGDAAEQTIALLGGALLVSPYAMNYEIALVVPAVLALRHSILWTLPFWLALILLPMGPYTLAIGFALPFVLRLVPASRA